MDEEIVSIFERELETVPSTFERVKEGLLHDTFAIAGADGDYILQFASDEDDDRVDSLRRGLGFFILLQDSTIPVPGVVTETVGEYDGCRYILVEKLPGETGYLAVSPDRARNAGRYLAKIHNFRRFGRSGWLRFDNHELSVHEFREGTLKRKILRDARDHASRLENGGLEAAAIEFKRVFDQVEKALPNSIEPGLCHDDYSPDNVLFVDGRVTGILDFDRAYSGHHQRDLVKAANNFWLHDPGSDWDVRGELYRGYRQVTELDSSFERREPLYRMETLLCIVADMLGLGILSNDEKEFYDERIIDTINRFEDR